MSEKYRFRFGDRITNQQVETRLLLAGINTENVFGESVMRLDASFRFDPATRVCEIDAGTEVGRHIAKLFVAYISKEFGDAAYEVERIADPKHDVLIPEGGNK